MSAPPRDPLTAEERAFVEKRRADLEEWRAAARETPLAAADSVDGRWLAILDRLAPPVPAGGGAHFIVQEIEREYCGGCGEVWPCRFWTQPGTGEKP